MAARLQPSYLHSLSPIESIQFLVFDLFAGIGGAHYALHTLGVTQQAPVHHFLFETDTLCREVLQERVCSENTFLASSLDAQGLPGSVLALIEDDCALFINILSKYPNLKGCLLYTSPSPRDRG